MTSSQYLPFKDTSPLECFASENDLNETEDIWFKRIIINFIKEFKESKKDKKQLNESKEKELRENKHLHDTVENT